MLLGAHVSVAGGLHLAPGRAREIGAEAMQIFTRNQRTWSAPAVSRAEAAAFRKARAAAGIRRVVAHASYLANPAAPDPDILERTRSLLAQEVERCAALGVELLVLHPGARKETPLEDALQRVAESLAPLLAPAAAAGLVVALENTAGQGSALGGDFAELGAVIALLGGHHALGVCLDTAHAWAAGYGLRGRDLAATLARLAREAGPGRLAGLHLNDTPGGRGGRRDRHAPLGEGNLGLGLFRRLQRRPELADLPGILETPSGMAGWAREIQALRPGRHP